MRLIIAAAMLISLIHPLNAQNCKCVALKPEETTRRGYSADIVIVEGKKSYKLLQGIVRFPNGVPVENAFVEVFTYPEYWLTSYKDREKKSEQQVRIAACKTGVDGEFCFADMPKGKYELRLSLDGGFGITHFIMKIDPKSRRSTGEKIIGTIEPGA